MAARPMEEKDAVRRSLAIHLEISLRTHLAQAETIHAQHLLSPYPKAVRFGLKSYSTLYRWNAELCRAYTV